MSAWRSGARLTCSGAGPAPSSWHRAAVGIFEGFVKAKKDLWGFEGSLGPHDLHDEAVDFVAFSIRDCEPADPSRTRTSRPLGIRSCALGWLYWICAGSWVSLSGVFGAVVSWPPSPSTLGCFHLLRSPTLGGFYISYPWGGCVEPNRTSCGTFS